MTYVKVTLVRSFNGRTDPQQATLRGLGLRKIGGTSVLQNTPSVRGMIKTVLHLLEVQEVASQDA